MDRMESVPPAVAGGEHSQSCHSLPQVVLTRLTEKNPVHLVNPV